MNPASRPESSGYTFRMTSKEAIQFMDAPGILIICHLAEPWYGTGSHFITPTFDLPIDTRTDLDYLWAVPAELWVFNQKTGVVYRKLNEGECYYSTLPISPSSPNDTEQRHSDCFTEKMKIIEAGMRFNGSLRHGQQS